ncbi:MAG TPA: diphosphomevalonate decarboxylase, partial [Burkholderiales bacterium]|nr:diphosphomevalonate decarboxylase [Burkholderiales bacterium]
MTATARAHPNIAIVKYWGRSDEKRNLPLTSSLSMTMGGVQTTTTVRVDANLSRDLVSIDGQPAPKPAHDRVVSHLDRLRARSKERPRMEVVSRNDFPQGSGLASSASAFSALTVAASRALDLQLSPREQSVIARQGSGSAARSLFGGWVVWHAGKTSDESFAQQVAPASALDIVDLVAIVSRAHKKVGSQEGHSLAMTSPLNQGRLAAVPSLLTRAQAAILANDFAGVGQVAEEDALLMHSVMMTSKPSLFYWEPATLSLLRIVRAAREDGLACYFTIDAGPNVHVLTSAQDAIAVEGRLRIAGAMEVLRCPPGEGPTLLTTHLEA